MSGGLRVGEGVVGGLRQDDALASSGVVTKLVHAREPEALKQRPILAGDRPGDGPGADALLQRDLGGLDMGEDAPRDRMGTACIRDDLDMGSHGQTLAFLLSDVNRTSVAPVCSASAMTPGDRLRQKRQEKGLTAEELAARVGRSVSAVRNQENGTNGIPAPLARKYAAALGTTAGWILYGDDTPEAPLAPSMNELPIIGPIQAGAWLMLDETAQDEPIFFSAVADRRYPHARQWLREVRGDSMNARGITPGDLAHIVDLGEAGINLNTGMIVEVTRSRDGGSLREITLKEVEIGPDGVKLWPRSTNPRWAEPLVLVDGDRDAHVQVTGLLLQAIKRFS